jgi:hypothetical protein
MMDFMHSDVEAGFDKYREREKTTSLLKINPEDEDETRVEDQIWVIDAFEKEDNPTEGYTTKRGVAYIYAQYFGWEVQNYQNIPGLGKQWIQTCDQNTELYGEYIKGKKISSNCEYRQASIAVRV